ncbi:chemotaxis protein CheC [Halobiforma nitratireducens]|uniref:Taxis cluster protein CheC 1 n=1 Tax=Halobiforma nitratireducens JCM 10879 TaxID=1227454 RepID=M0M1E7_9EURY|nr:chemotaxis protein CheC [Halobiforma nitratireducens]EMA38220.1 taxis cluster protein CheC 1 [Halobiforma nitratireducens JCM 10879]
MEIDIQSLKTYNELARSGGESAAQALAELTGLETRVEVTDVSLLSTADLEYEFAGREFAGVEVGLGDPLSGTTVLAFDADGRKTITRGLVPNAGGEAPDHDLDPDLTESAIVEAGNIMVNGFVSGWADHLETKVEVSPPDYVEGAGVAVLPEDLTEDEYVVVFRSRVDAVDEDVSFRMLLFPELASLERLLETRPDDPDDGSVGRGRIPLEKLEVFSEMTERGSAKAADNVANMTQLSTAVEVNRLRFVPLVDVPTHVSDRRRIGTVVQFDGTPSGHLAILFDPGAARTAVGALPFIDLEPDGDEAGEGEIEWAGRRREALEELGNVIASGFIDGWANVLETSIEHSPPAFVDDMGSSIVSPIIADVGREENYAFLLDSAIRIGDTDTLQCQLFAVPRPAELESALDDLLVERADETDVDPDDLF